MRSDDNMLEFVAERVRRGSYSPDDVRRQLLGRKGIDPAIMQRLMQAAANRKKKAKIEGKIQTLTEKIKDLGKQLKSIK